jgi:ATP-dependent DNA helicase RecG
MVPAHPDHAMRPTILFKLFAAADSLPGIGPKLAKTLERIGLGRVVDLLWHLPTAVIDRRQVCTIAAAPEGAIATLVVTVDQHLPAKSPRHPYKVRCRDGTGFMHLVFFHAKGDYLGKTLPVGAQRVVSGRIERFRDEVQMAHPEHLAPAEELDRVATVEPVYGLTAGVTPRVMAKAVHGAVALAPVLPEWIDAALAARKHWPSWQEAVQLVHAPASEADLQKETPARSRIAYDELLANQLALALVRAQQRQLPGLPMSGDGALRKRVLAALPFSLTRSQETALAEIAGDLAGEARMLRLLQGDVGSGKTVVALLAMLIAVEAGAQAALMAPTEILARQHHATIEPLARAAGVEVAAVTGRDQGRIKAELRERIADGGVKLVIGTHALLQEDLTFANLGLAVIDEQHRFGVHQRLALADKGGSHVLVMTATPIPRTLTMCAYGDMDVSRLTEKPAGRKPIDTRVMPVERLGELLDAVERRLHADARVYWVCPLVEESELVDLAAAEERHAQLAQRFGAARVGLIHGRQKPSERDRTMERFASGELRVLVATTVIEVGVDVPEATVMVVEHAERFGLAQLHQLRGRIGRGEAASSCILLYAPPLSEGARARLQIMRETEDGFRIAEEDLRLRGAGEMLGTRQSGMPEFRLADMAAHGDLIEVARDDARLALERDPQLESPRGEAIRTLLYLFERDAAVRLLRSG